jgi:diazepam-binding inhibitor (GABA receptor modulating acyl-CoA-binding protein)
VQPSQSEQLVFYGLFKQAQNGDVTTSRPGMMDFTGKAKWDAWKKNEGISQDEAKQKYVDALLAIFAKSGELLFLLAGDHRTYSDAFFCFCLR